MDAYRRAEDMGIDLVQQWRAVVDMRTRHEHRQLDGQIRPVGEPFEVDGYEIMYPGDPQAPGHLIWNCRCGLRGVVKGLEPQAIKYRSLEKIEGMTYDEWRESKVEKPHRITKQEVQTAFFNGLDMDEHGYHLTMKYLSEELKFSYERKKKTE